MLKIGDKFKLKNADGGRTYEVTSIKGDMCMLDNCDDFVWLNTPMEAIEMMDDKWGQIVKRTIDA